MASNSQHFPLELPGRFPKIATHEWPLSANGEVRYEVLPHFDGHPECPQ